MPRDARRRASVLLVVGLTALATVLGPAAPAQAHPALVATEPAAGYALTDPPRDLVLRFNEPVQPVDGGLALHGPDGTALPVRTVAEEGRSVLRGRPAAALGAGRFALRYRVVAQDGDLITGEVAFGVGTAAAGARPDAGAAIDRSTAVLRALLFGGFAVALGGALAARVARSATGGYATLAPWVRPGAAVGGLAAIGQLGGLGALRLGPSALLAAPGATRLLLVQTGLFAVAVLAARRPLRGRLAVAALAGVLVVEGLRAHPTRTLALAGAALTVVHLLAAAVWLGGLVHLLRLAVHWRSNGLATRYAALAYARVALLSLVLLVGTGTASALLLLDGAGQLTGTAYGRVLLAKLAVVLAVLLAAVAARTRLRRTDPEHRRELRPLARAARAEAVLLAGVLLVTGVLTAATPARPTAAAATLLPAPVGPVLHVAQRPRQVSVSAAASAGRLDLRADAPNDGRPVRYRLRAEVAGPDGRTVPVALRGCGQGCWTGPVAWGVGTSTVRADVAAPPWEAGPVRLDVAWPPVAATDLPRRVREAMLAQPSVQVSERVTSGFGVVVPSTSSRTGVEYVRGQPWAGGGPADATAGRDGGRQVLSFVVPGLGYTFRMVLDEQDRIVAERIVTKTSVLLREYRYAGRPRPSS